MEKMLLGNCCCCISLKTGTILIALLGLLGNAFVFCLGIIASLTGNFHDTSIFHELNPGPVYIVDDYRDAKILIPSAVILISIDSVLLYAAIKGIPKHMLPWLILQGSMLVASLYFVLSFMVAYPAVLIGIFGIPLGAYFWTVVFSYYRQLKNADKLETPGKMSSGP